MTDDPEITRLLKLAGPRNTVPAERLDRMRNAVHAAWHSATRPRRTWRWLVLAGLTSAAAVLLWTARSATPLAVPPVVAAREVATAAGEFVTLPLDTGGQVRLDANSEVASPRTAVQSGSNAGHCTRLARLHHGAQGDHPDAVVTDVGTRFEVRLIGGATRVRVRDGRVTVSVEGAVPDAGAGEQLTSGPVTRAGVQAGSVSKPRRRVRRGLGVGHARRAAV